MRTIFHYQTQLILSLDCYRFIKKPAPLYAHPTGDGNLRGRVGSGPWADALPEKLWWRLSNGAMLLFRETVEIRDSELYRVAYTYSYRQPIARADGATDTFFFRFELEDIPATPAKPQPHLHVKGTHPTAHKIHFPSPVVTLQQVLDLIQYHLI